MQIDNSVLKNDEKAIFGLRSLYSKHGYTQYKMNKFEEYDLYVRNKDFLVSDNIITFTDTSGKLMALKPDVTLSIVRGDREAAAVRKVCYSENVYRCARSGGFAEIMQVGLECLGDIDDYCVSEVLLLAAESLRRIAPEGVLTLSHLGVLTALIDGCGVSREAAAEMLACIGEKNAHGLSLCCAQNGVEAVRAEALESLCACYGAPDTVLPQWERILDGLVDTAPLSQLGQVIASLPETVRAMLRIDCAVVDNPRYYNGVVFRGFVPGLPDSVLSGGRYDGLVRRMGRTHGAIGFAVYADRLERLDDGRGFDVDAVLLYDGDCTPDAVLTAVQSLTAEGLRVTAQRALPEKLTWRRLLRLVGNEVTLLEDHA